MAKVRHYPFPCEPLPIGRALASHTRDAPTGQGTRRAAAEEEQWTIYDPAVTDTFPDDLIELERAAWTEIQAGALTVTTAQAVHDAVAAHAEETGLARLDIEMGLKRIVRHPAVEG